VVEGEVLDRAAVTLRMLMLDKADVVLVEGKVFNVSNAYGGQSSCSGLAREVSKDRASIRCRGIWACVMRKCRKATGSSNHADWKQDRPVFVHQKDCEGILDSWMTKEWKRLSVSRTANRKRILVKMRALACMLDIPEAMSTLAYNVNE
nr:hypothetical protein [Tanacetum cinerariifolium]